MSHEPVALYSIVEDEDVLGTGITIYTSTDDCYRLRFGEDAITCCYREDGSWTATVRYPVGSVEKGYTQFQEAAVALDDAYDTKFDTPVMDFHRDVEADGTVQHEEAGHTLTYREAPDIDLPTYTRDYSLIEKGKNLVLGTGMGTGMIGIPGSVLGGAVGGVAGLLLGDPVHTAMLGAGIGGGGGGGLGGLAGVQAGREINEGGVTTRFNPREMYENALNEEEETPVHGLFDRVNERNLLRVRLEEVRDYDPDAIERFNALEEQDLDAWLDDAMSVMFRDAHLLDGVTVTTTAPYDAATDLLETVHDEPLDTREPSIYTEPDAFRDIMERLVETGAEEAAHAVVEGVWEAGEDAEQIREWLDAERPDLVQAVGQKRNLERS